MGAGWHKSKVCRSILQAEFLALRPKVVIILKFFLNQQEKILKKDEYVKGSVSKSIDNIKENRFLKKFLRYNALIWMSDLCQT